MALSESADITLTFWASRLFYYKNFTDTISVAIIQHIGIFGIQTINSDLIIFEEKVHVLSLILFTRVFTMLKRGHSRVNISKQIHLQEL